jgi:hypothetical protein
VQDILKSRVEAELQKLEAEEQDAQAILRQRVLSVVQGNNQLLSNLIRMVFSN